MKGTSRISFKPYYPLIKYSEEVKKPYICHLVPFETGFSGEWIKPEENADYFLCCGEENSKINKIKLSRTSFEVDNLHPNKDYKIYIESLSGLKSNTRLIHTGKAPSGTTVVNYLHPKDNQYIFSGKYLCSPSITGISCGTLFASMDVFGSEMPQNLTLLFRSDDDGRTWNYVCDIFGFYWGLLFSRGNELYLLGLSTEYGNLKITKSVDKGESWSAPVTIFNGSDRSCVYGGLHRAPMHLTEYNGRLYTSIEYGSWQSGGHLPGILSVQIGSDYLNPENWEITDFLSFEGKWKEACCGDKKDSIEGNLVVNTDGVLQNILRWDKEKALVLNVGDSGLEFEEIRNMPVSDSMFRVLKYKDKYLLVSNRRPDGFDDTLGSFKRSIISLFISDDMKSWKLIKDIVNFGDKDMMKYGFQYPSVYLRKDVLYLLIRSSYNGASGYHDSNTILFARIDLKEETKFTP